MRNLKIIQEVLISGDIEQPEAGLLALVAVRRNHECTFACVIMYRCVFGGRGGLDDEGDQLHLHLQSTACAAANTVARSVTIPSQKMGKKERRASRRRRDEEFLADITSSLHCKMRECQWWPDTETPDRRSIDS